MRVTEKEISAGIGEEETDLARDEEHSLKPPAQTTEEKLVI